MSTSPYHSPLCPPQDGGRTECWASREMDDASARGRVEVGQGGCGGSRRGQLVQDTEVWVSASGS